VTSWEVVVVVVIAEMVGTSLPVVLSLVMGSICNCDTISIISFISIIISSIIMMMIIIICNGDGRDSGWIRSR